MFDQVWINFRLIQTLHAPKTDWLRQNMLGRKLIFPILEASLFDEMFDCFLNNNFAALNEKLGIERLRLHWIWSLIQSNIFHSYCIYYWVTKITQIVRDETIPDKTCSKTITNRYLQCNFSLYFWNEMKETVNSEILKNVSSGRIKTGALHPVSRIHWKYTLSE